MTMLDQMRRHKGWLKWSLGLIVLAFVIAYIPDFLRRDVTGAVINTDTVATVEGRQISAADFRRSYDAQLQAYRNAYGANVSEQLLKRSEEHTSELQSRGHLVCRRLLAKKKNTARRRWWGHHIEPKTSGSRSSRTS